MCISFLSHGQSKLDSLKNLLQEARYSNKSKNEAYLLYFIGYYFYQQHKHDSALYYYKRVLEKDPDEATKASALNGIGMTYSALGLPDKSIPFYNEAIILLEDQRDTANAVIASYNLAIIYKDKGLYDDALEISFNALAKLERRKPDRALASSYNTIGTVYSRLQDYEKAYEYYRKALNVRLTIGYEQGVGQSYANLGELFLLMGQYDSALANLERARSLRQKLNDNRGMGRTLTLIGTGLLKSGNPSKGREQLMHALDINRTSEDNIGEVATLNALASANITLRDFRSASNDLLAASALIRKTHTTEDLRKTLELQAELYRLTGDKSKLIATLERLQVVKDSLLNAGKVDNLNTLEIKYETEKKEQEIALLQQQRQIDQIRLDQNKSLIIFLGVAIAMAIVIVALVLNLYRLSRRRKESAEFHTREIHHRITNNLQMLISFFTIQQSLLNDQRATEVLKGTEGRVNAMVLIHKRLYDDQRTTQLDLKDYLTELVEYLVFSYGFEGKLTINTNIDNVTVMGDKAIPIGLVLNELISNALKYAYNGQDDPSLKLKVAKTGGTIFN